MLARQIRRLRPGLVLLQHPDDLIFREPRSLHLSVLQEARTLNPRGGKSQRQVSAIVFKEGGFYVAQCLEYDVSAQSSTIEGLIDRLELTLEAEFEACEGGGKSPEGLYWA